jgi:hypothetical protein
MPDCTEGIYVLRTTVTGGELGSGEVVSSYKALAQVERAFRAFKYRPGHPPDPPPRPGPGPCARVLADAVVLHHLAHAGPPRAEECLQHAKGEAGLDHYPVRTWRAWYARIIVSMLALAWLAASKAQARKGGPVPAAPA